MGGSAWNRKTWNSETNVTFQGKLVCFLDCRNGTLTIEDERVGHEHFVCFLMFLFSEHYPFHPFVSKNVLQVNNDISSLLWLHTFYRMFSRRFFKFFITRVTFFVFFLDCFGSWVFRGKQPGTLQRGHQLLFDALVTSFTAETLVVCSEHREPARFDHQQYLDDSHGKGLSMAQSVRTLDRGWIFERNTMKKWAKKSSKKQHQWFFIPAPSNGWCLNPKGLLNSHPNSHPFGTPAAGSSFFLGVFFEKPVRNEKFNSQVLFLVCGWKQLQMFFADVFST